MELREMTNEEIGHELRKKISAATDYAKFMAEKVGREAGGREVALTITKLQEAKMWAGKACGELGSKLPDGYPHDNAQ